MKYSDKMSKGYLSISNFVDKLIDLATETKGDTMLRRFANTLKH